MRGQVRGEVRGDVRGEVRVDVKGDVRGEVRGDIYFFLSAFEQFRESEDGPASLSLDYHEFPGPGEK